MLCVPVALAVIFVFMNVVLSYFRSKERQMFIERGYTPEELKNYFVQHKGKNTMFLKTGIVFLFLGIGLGLGIHLEDTLHINGAEPLCIFVFVGTGTIVAHFLTEKLYGKKDEKEGE
jgi:hypothetical protein